MLDKHHSEGGVGSTVQLTRRTSLFLFYRRSTFGSLVQLNLHHLLLYLDSGVIVMDSKMHEVEWPSAMNASIKRDRYIQQQANKKGKLHTSTHQHIQDLYKADLSRCVEEASLLGDSATAELLLQLVLGRPVQLADLPSTPHRIMSKSQIMGIYRTAIDNLVPREYMQDHLKLCIALLKHWFTVSYQPGRLYAGSAYRYNMAFIPKFFFAFVMTFSQAYEHNRVAEFQKELLDWTNWVAAGSDARSVPPSVYNVFSALDVALNLTRTGVEIWYALHDTALQIVFDKVEAPYALSRDQLFNSTNRAQHDFILACIADMQKHSQTKQLKEVAE